MSELPWITLPEGTRPLHWEAGWQQLYVVAIDIAESDIESEQVLTRRVFY